MPLVTQYIRASLFEVLLARLLKLLLRETTSSGSSAFRNAFLTVCFSVIVVQEMRSEWSHARVCPCRAQWCHV